MTDQEEIEELKEEIVTLKSALKQKEPAPEEVTSTTARHN